MLHTYLEWSEYHVGFHGLFDPRAETIDHNDPQFERPATILRVQLQPLGKTMKSKHSWPGDGNFTAFPPICTHLFEKV